MADLIDAEDTLVVLPDGYMVPKPLFDSIKKEVIKFLPRANRHKAIKSPELFCSSFWKSLTRAEKSLAGRCIAHLVATKDLPLVAIKGRNKDDRFYRPMSLDERAAFNAGVNDRSSSSKVI